MEARVVHLKSKELQDTQQDSTVSLDCCWSLTLSLDSVWWLWFFLIRIHWLLYAILITPICCCTDILIFFLGKRFRACKFLRHREILNCICSLGRLLLNGDLKTFLYYWLFSVVNITSLLHWHFPSSLTSIRDTFPWFGISLTFWPSFSFPATQNFNFDSSSLSSFCLL